MFHPSVGSCVQGLGMIKAWLSAGWGPLSRGQSGRRRRRRGGGWGWDHSYWLAVWILENPGEVFQTFRSAGESLAHGAGGICLPWRVEIRDGESGVERNLRRKIFTYKRMSQWIFMEVFLPAGGAVELFSQWMQRFLSAFFTQKQQQKWKKSLRAIRNSKLLSVVESLMLSLSRFNPLSLYLFILKKHF